MFDVGDLYKAKAGIQDPLSSRTEKHRQKEMSRNTFSFSSLVMYVFVWEK